MRITEKDEEIILRDIPFKKWISGIFLFLFFGLAGILYFADAVKYLTSMVELQYSWFKIALNILWVLFTLVIITALLWTPVTDLLIPQITTRIKPAAQTVDVIIRKLLFIKKTERFYFSQIKCFEIINRSADKTDLYFNVLTLVNGSQIDLQSKGSRKSSTVEIQKKLNELLKKSKIESIKNKSKIIKSRKNKGKDES